MARRALPLWALGFLVGLAAAGAGTAMAQGGWGRGPGPFGFLDTLDLEPAQREALAAVRAGMRTDCSPPQSESDPQFRLLELAMSPEAPPPPALHEAVDAEIERSRLAAHCVLDRLVAFRDTLTPEQRTLVAAHLGQARERRRRWMEGWGDPHGPR
jgi:Spy/CpxP family protein refolding chaperone